MKPIGILMREHRIIERMLLLLEKEKEGLKTSGKIRQDFVSPAIDFFRVYGDKNHHGKEEDILFRSLSAKPLSMEHRRIISQLIDEHNMARTYIRVLDNARERYFHGSSTARFEIIEAVEHMLALYTAHIETEEKRFFYPVMNYFSDDEQNQMIRDLFEYEPSINKEKYESLVKQLEADLPVVVNKVYDAW